MAMAAVATAAERARGLNGQKLTNKGRFSSVAAIVRMETTISANGN